MKDKCLQGVYIGFIDRNKPVILEKTLKKSTGFVLGTLGKGRTFIVEEKR